MGCAAIERAVVSVSRTIPIVRQVAIDLLLRSARPGRNANRSTSAENDAGGEFPVRVERALDGAHLVDTAVAVEPPQQRLLHGIPADTMLGERTAAESRALAPEEENCFRSALDVFIRRRQNVGMDVAVRDVAPDGRVEAARREAL